jgi:hypothetical protein
LRPDDAPPDVEGFNEDVVGVDGFVMPATQHDAVLWLSGSAYDVIFDTARAAIASLRERASVAEETSSWSYRHDLDLTGFIDGTKNPTLIDAPEVALIPEGSPRSRRNDPAPPEVGARRGGLGVALGRGAGARDGTHEARQRRVRGPVG